MNDEFKSLYPQEVDPDLTDVPEAPVEPVKKKSYKPSPKLVEPEYHEPQGTKMLRMINKHQFDGKYLMFDDETKQAWLVPADKVVYMVDHQEIALRDLENAEHPYNWDDEIEAITIGVEDIRFALWRKGLVSKGDGSLGDVKKLLTALISQGVLPVSKEGR